VPDLGASVAPAKRVLIAVPSEPLAQLSSAFTNKGWVVRGASTGQGAIDFVWQEAFDALVTVVQLPDMRGDVLFLGASAVWPQLRERSVFLLTDNANESIARMAGCPTLPIDTDADRVVDRIERLFSRTPS
jgi:DNA-binding response OmpR family regulator